MVIDTSAVLAIIQQESDADRYFEAIRIAPRRSMSVANWLEAAIIIDSRGDSVASREFDLLLRAIGVIIEPVTLEHAALARQAYRTYGKGHHRARLNLGDSFAYALAKSLDEPLLFKGNDFTETDVLPALPPL